MRQLLAFIVLAGCGGEFCVEDQVAITQGLYGLVTYQTDVNPDENGPQPVVSEPIDVLDAPFGTVIAQGASNTRGVYEVSLAIGSYVLCSPQPRHCVAFSIAHEELVRADLRKGFGGASWVGVDRSNCAD
ncbi:MAG TPA: hypothetical protein VIV11_13790 [Kofleriaceae bacterium]